MRVPGDLARFHAGLAHLHARLEGAEAARERLATGKRFAAVSEDVTAAGRAMALRAELRVHEQYARNAADGAVWVDLADTTLQDVVGRLQRARELAVQGASSTNAAARPAIAAEIEALRDEVAGLANRRHLGRGLFAGFALDDAVSGSGGAWTYTGDLGTMERRVGDAETVEVSLTAHGVFGFAAGQDVFTMLDDLAAALRAGDQAGIRGGIDGIDAARERVTDGLARLGAAGARLEAEGVRIDGTILAGREELGEAEDVDFAEAVMELQLHEAAYEAALAAFARARHSSLVDFLR